MKVNVAFKTMVTRTYVQKTRKYVFSFFVSCNIFTLMIFVKIKKYLWTINMKTSGFIGLKYRVVHLENICAS
jgi:hypothetical protein